MDKHADKHDKYFEDSETADVARIHEKFNMLLHHQPRTLTPDLLMPRAEFLEEEVFELREAIQSRDFLEVIDALVDIVVVAKGTAVMMGLRWGRHWDEVDRANREKVRGKNSKRPDLEEDLIKPPGWQGPDHYNVLQTYHRGSEV